MSNRSIGLPSDRAVERSTVCKNATELRYWVAGAGSAVVCVNAHGQDLLVFSKLIEGLSKSHRIIAWKPRGTFDSCREHRLEDQICDLERILDEEQITRCSLITWCSGAKVGLEYARRSERVRSLVLVNGTFASIPGLEKLNTIFENTLAELCASVVRKPALASLVMRSMRSLLVGGASGLPKGGTGTSAGTSDPALNALIVEPFQSPETTARYAAQVVDYLGHDISAALDHVHVPALVISGGEDRVSSAEMGRVVAKRLPRGRAVQVPDGSHYWLYEDPVNATALIGRFLFDVEADPASKEHFAST